MLGVRPFLAAILFCSVFSGGSAQAHEAPSCLADDGSTLSVDDQEVLNWEGTTNPEFLARAYVSGPITQVLPNESGHTHFNVKIGSGANDVVELIYDNKFGKLPHLHSGMQVEACGDYITVVPHSSGTTGYAPGILHWVHRADANQQGPDHEPGFVTINGALYGQQ